MENNAKNISEFLKQEIVKETTSKKSRGMHEIIIHNASAKQYAKAIFEIALEENKVDLIKEDFQILADVFLGNEDIIRFFSSPFIDGKIKNTILDKVFTKPIQKETLNMLYVLLDKSLIKILSDVVYEYDNLCNNHYHITDVFVKTAKQLDNTKELESSIEKLLGRKIKLHIEIDETLIGGITLEADGEVFDYSIKTNLKKLKESILKKDLPKSILYKS